MRCRHRNWFDHLARGVGDGLDMEYRRCVDCGAWLSLGPSNDTRCEVEMRATEIAVLASEWDTTRSIDSAIAMTNIGGPRSEAAELARVIYEHED